ncbi:hypothetical protein Kpol_1043p23 [Vanderwaltozyma polyspora DSM 70294]|uniref:Zn(2)-C6 fungal-type domain-containing protein n=1 Tax=Vanderwaltozyma polyspora (strain ATCC 22028 / DSM 70294 / BCRC 21397 / CBS 2163 / NBRC 10782 / NRRL Y-8283 / UCD 57-17) TaxID=436907 RepID=A7TIP1_VANPO|nr:uncharacterized protein Kpol_1043p23 [Vanderwaltozyma polyspora DSM 70294]EDO17833.1 hypothetical protein Kpol_1043p23 [Vanderwaltozyma polyspora DSM 70294]
MAGPVKSREVCANCARRKVKCDRLVPCGNCVRRGLEVSCNPNGSGSGSGSGLGPGFDESVSNVSSKSSLALWQAYERYVVDIGLFKVSNQDVKDAYEDVSSDIHETEYLMACLNEEDSYSLLNYAVENLGPLFFGCLADVSELYPMLDRYWQRRNLHRQKNGSVIFSVDENYETTLLWSIFALSVYYIDCQQLDALFESDVLSRVLDISSSPSSRAKTITEQVQSQLFDFIIKLITVLLYKTNFMTYPDIRLVQIHIILSATSFLTSHRSLSDSILLQSFSVAKMYQLGNLQRSVNDSTIEQLIKITTEKMWYRLCISDYLSSGPSNRITFHHQISSLLQQQLPNEDSSNLDVCQSEDTFDSLFWKILSLDRDIDQYLIRDSKPPMKTLDAISKFEENLHERVSSIGELESKNSQFEKFILIYLLNSISWKLNKSYFIYYDTSGSLEKSMHHVKVMIELLVKNFNHSPLFNKHPIVINCFSKISLFYSFYYTFNDSTTLKDLCLDINEVIMNLSDLFKPALSKLIILITRFKKLKLIWDQVKVLDSDNALNHPVITILKDDINFIKKSINHLPPIISGTSSSMLYKRTLDDEDIDAFKGNKSEAFKLIISEFESEFNIQEIIY